MVFYFIPALNASEETFGEESRTDYESMDYEVVATNQEVRYNRGERVTIAVGAVINEDLSEETLVEIVEWMRGDGPFRDGEYGRYFTSEDYDEYDVSITEFYGAREEIAEGDVQGVVLDFASYRGVEYFGNPDFDLYGGVGGEGVYVFDKDELADYSAMTREISK
jgi:hypothetical protein